MCAKWEFHHNQLIDILNFLLEKNYTSICEEQPIGQRLFADFCATKPELSICRQCLDQMVSFGVAIMLM